MPTLAADDGVKLYYEEAGSGTALLFVHEFAGDHRSWEPQLRHFSRRYRCIAYNARGYPPSEVPEEFDRYSQDRARDDARAVLDGLGIRKAHVVGLSMGAFATLHFGLAYPDRALSITTAGVGSGAPPAQYASGPFRAKPVIRHLPLKQVKNVCGSGYARFLKPRAPARNETVQAAGMANADFALGCARLTASECIVHLPSDVRTALPALYRVLLAHELAHCRGWVH